MRKDVRGPSPGEQGLVVIARIDVRRVPALTSFDNDDSGDVVTFLGVLFDTFVEVRLSAVEDKRYETAGLVDDFKTRLGESRQACREFEKTRVRVVSTAEVRLHRGGHPKSPH